MEKNTAITRGKILVGVRRIRIMIKIYEVKRIQRQDLISNLVDRKKKCNIANKR